MQSWLHRHDICARQLVEKTIEHDTKAFIFFIGLKKAYDSVPRAATWLVLAKHGVPDILISVIKSLHDSMQAGISMEGNLANINVSNGLRQGCVLAPTLFILFSM